MCQRQAILFGFQDSLVSSWPFFPDTTWGASGCERTSDMPWYYLSLKDQCAALPGLSLLVRCPSASNSLDNWILSFLWKHIWCYSGIFSKWSFFREWRVETNIMNYRGNQTMSNELKPIYACGDGKVNSTKILLRKFKKSSTL